MKVSQIGSGSAAAATRRTQKGDKGEKAGRSSFASHLDTVMEVEEPSGGEGPAALASVDALLALQSATEDGGGDRNEARRRAMARAETILDRLEDVRRGLLTGAIPTERLAELAQAMRAKREEGVDVRLAAILDEIELRAEVEMAKLSRR